MQRLGCVVVVSVAAHLNKALETVAGALTGAPFASVDRGGHVAKMEERKKKAIRGRHVTILKPSHKKMQ